MLGLKVCHSEQVPQPSATEPEWQCTPKLTPTWLHTALTGRESLKLPHSLAPCDLERQNTHNMTPTRFHGQCLRQPPPQSQNRQNKPEMTPSPVVFCHIAQVGHSTPETTPDTQNPQVPLRRANQAIERVEEKQKDVCSRKQDRTGDSRVIRNSLM